MIEKTLVLLKPDAVARGYSGEILSRFEKAGLKIAGIKMVHADKEHAGKHYTEDISERRGEHVRKKMIGELTRSPVIAVCLEGVNAVEQTRKMVGDTEPRKARPGTIRGDYSHATYNYADKNNVAVRNIVHASADVKDAESEVKLWFTDSELYSYKSVHDYEIL